MLLTYKFRIYPSKEQEQKLFFVLDKCRLTYNKLLEILNKQEKINQNEIQAAIPKLKEQYPELNEIYSKTLQYECYRLFSNLRALSRLKKNGKNIGCLRFKGKDWFKTFTYNQSGFVLEIKNRKYNKLHLSKIGSLSIRTHRIINGEIKQVQIKRECSGKWFALLCIHKREEKPRVKTNKQIGLDLGTINFIYDSDGNHINHPKFLNKSLKKLAAEQRKLSKKKKGSSNRIKQKIRVAKVHEIICNQRNDFLHKLSRKYVNNYDFMAAEDLNIRNIIEKSYSARNIMDASWNSFLQMLR
ncbi:MAG: transposase, partial [archaeon]